MSTADDKGLALRDALVEDAARAALPDVFLTYQQQLWREIEAHGVTVIEKSRRTGFSWALAAIAVGQAALGRAEGGSDVLYMGYEKDMTREFIGYVADWAKAMQAAASEVEEFLWHDPDKPERDIGAYRVSFASGFEIIALPSVPRALRGKQGLVILDEAAFMDDLDAVITSAMALRIWGGKVVICSTHQGELNPFNVLVNDIRAGKKPYGLMRLTFDQAVADGLCKRTLAKQGLPWSPEIEREWVAGIRAEYGDKADEELDVIPSPTSGTYLSSILLEARASADIPVLNYECDGGFKLLPEAIRERATLAWCEEHLAPVLATLDPARRHVMGEDFGRIGDLTVFWPLAIGQDLVRRTPFVAELRNVPFEQQRTILFYICDRLPMFGALHMDAGGNGMYLAEVATQQYGEMVASIQLSEPWYRENMPKLKAAIEEGQLTLPANDDTLGDFRMLQLVRGVGRVPDRRRVDASKPRHGDAAIAACLAIAASRAEPMEYGYRGAPAPHLAARGPGYGRERPDEDFADRPRRIVRQLRGAL